jgi:tetratricopeptide (TPR) repeat protein
MLVSVKRLLLSSSFLIILAACTNIPYNTVLAIINTAISNDTGTSNNISNITGLNDTSAVQPTPLPKANHPPVANAGTNQIVNENTTVALVGAGIDSDPMNTLSYLWRQIDGPAVELSNRSSTNPTFTAPTVPSETDLRFFLTVTDNKGAISTPSQVDVTVKAAETNATISNINTLIGKGSALHSQGMCDDALQTYLLALSIDPNNIDALVGKADVLYNLSRYDNSNYDNALQTYLQALSIDPNNIDASNGRYKAQNVRNASSICSIDNPQ